MTVSESLYQQAKHALAEYHAEIAAGGEPVYPAWAVEIVKQYSSTTTTKREQLNEHQ